MADTYCEYEPKIVTTRHQVNVPLYHIDDLLLLIKHTETADPERQKALDETARALRFLKAYPRAHRVGEAEDLMFRALDLTGAPYNRDPRPCR